MMDRGKFSILGVRVDAVDYEAATDRIIRAAQERRSYSVTALAVHGVMTGVLDRVHRYRLNQFDMIVPDGQPVRWALNHLHGASLTDRVYGPQLTLELCQRAAQEGLPIYLFGGTPAMLAALSERLIASFPALRIAGAEPSRFRRASDAEVRETAARIMTSGAVITFVGLGCPRQEVWTYEMRQHLNMPVIAVGAAFAFHAGLLPQAPAWLQARGLEWLYRLIQEPRRLWKRYLLLNPLYLTLLALQYCRLHQIDSADGFRPEQLLNYG
jgi:N-acetylglucosaminyldiphosphoundecaprenol N-acetyl-beta-D-mannosaminyltransferase